MYFVQIPATLSEACYRTRQHVSLRLDSQLSELEVAVMENHLARCASCRAFADALEDVTETLRDADLVEPPIGFDVPHRPARFGVSRAGVTAVAALFVAVAIGGVLGLGPDGTTTRAYLANQQSAQEQLSVEEHLSLVDAAATSPQRHRRLATAQHTAITGAPNGADAPGSSGPSNEGW